jgi:predicted dehydrogenase
MSAIPNTGPRRVRLGFVGLGWIGRKRLDAIANDATIEIAGLFDSTREKLDDAAKSYPTAASASSLNELIDLGVDGVVIATPNGAHATQALRCLQNGVAVFCQKPLATTGAEVQQIVAAARAADRLLGIDFCYRHVAGMSELKRRIASGALGEITAIDLKFHNAYGPDKQWCFDKRMAGGGCLLDLGVHLLDLALWLQEGASLQLIDARRFSQGRVAKREDIEDQAYAELRQSNGALVRIASSWYAQIGCDAVIEARILGSKGGALWRNVGGSFYDFELFACRGAQRETLARGPDEWGPRALAAWAHRLAADRAFDPAALDITRSADLIDAIYSA